MPITHCPRSFFHAPFSHTHTWFPKVESIFSMQLGPTRKATVPLFFSLDSLVSSLTQQLNSIIFQFGHREFCRKCGTSNSSKMKIILECTDMIIGQRETEKRVRERVVREWQANGNSCSFGSVRSSRCICAEWGFY